MPQTIQRSFTSGELAPALQSRADLTKYTTGLSLCENFIIRAQGGAYSRPGFRFVAELDDSSKRARLIPFSFNVEQTYILVFEDLLMRVVKDGGLVLAGGGPTIFSLVTPYTEAQLSRLKFTQSADVMTIVHPDHDPRDLSRTADDAWTLAVNSYTSTVTAPGALTLTAGGGGGGANNRTYDYVVTAVDDDGVESLPSPSNSLNTSSLSVTYHISVNWATLPNIDYYRIYKDPSTSTNVFGWIGDSKNSVFRDFNIAPVISDTPPSDRTPFSGANDKPSTVTYYQQRQIFANTENEPQAVFTTQTDNHKSMRTSAPAKDDDAITFTIVGQQVNEIRHLLALDSLVLLTSGGEWIVTEGQDKVMTPSTIGVRIQSYNGASWVSPVVINSTALYVQEKGTRIRDLGYEFSSDKYTGNDLSLMSEHLFEGFEITAMAYAAEPYSVLWCVRDDGRLLGLTYQREHQVWGWHQHQTEGEFEDVATITEGSRDAVYVIVNRVIDGLTVRYIERMDPRESANAKDCFYVDSGLTLDTPSTIIDTTAGNPVVVTDTSHGYSDGDLVDIDDIVGMTQLNGNQYKIANTTTHTYELTDQFTDIDIDGTTFTLYDSGGTSRKAVTSITGLDHIEGEQVSVLANGNVVEGLTVVSGAITLPRAASRVHVGLGYLPVIQTLELDVGSVTETLKAQSLSVSKVTIELEQSRGGYVGPVQDDASAAPMVEIKPRFDSDGYDSIMLKTYKAEVFIQPDWNQGGGVRVEQRDPLPLSILSVIPQVDIGG